MKNQNFHTIYIDAFAGTGYQSLPNEDNPDELMLPELAEQDVTGFRDGSARKALQVTPTFSEYILVEKSMDRSVALDRLKADFPTVSRKIVVINDEANKYISELCINRNWLTTRAVLFLDPFGMQVDWSTITMIAQTRSIDMWYLFPLGVAVNRLLRCDGQISEAIQARLTRIFGTEDWYDAFYSKETQLDLFGETHEIRRKIANLTEISRFFIKQLQAVFGINGVATNPLPLYNSRNVPLYLLCFAAGSPTGAKIAVKIAGHILKP